MRRQCGVHPTFLIGALESGVSGALAETRRLETANAVRPQCASDARRMRRRLVLRITSVKGTTMRSSGSGKAPTLVVWVISLVLYVVALLSAFGVVPIPAQIAMWSWIVGFGLLLVACRVRGL